VLQTKIKDVVTLL